jgi:hypothetical protein
MIMLMSCSGSGSAGPALDVQNNQTSMKGEGGGALFDNDTELQTGFNGLSVDRAYIVDAEDKKISNSLIAINTKFSIVYEGVRNYALKDGKAFPAMAMLVTDGNQQPVISHDDMLSSYVDGLSIEDASVLRATLTIGEPLKAGSYSCSITVTDKNNRDASILSTWQFDVK